MNTKECHKIYPRLTQVLLGFLVASEDKIGDEEEVIAGGYLNESINSRQMERLKAEIDSVLALDDLPWMTVGDLANRYFATPEDCRQWLIKILHMIESWTENEARKTSPSND